MKRFADIKEALLHWVLPHTCSGCGSDRLNRSSHLCLRCLHSLPVTRFEFLANNPVEKIFWGRVQIEQGAAHCYFSRTSIVQQLMHQLKYRGNQPLGEQLGQIMGASLLQSNRFKVQAIIPVPLFAKRERERGYNQATLLSQGIGRLLQVPVLDHVITRAEASETQTRKNRIERWQNMEGKFHLQQPSHVAGKHVLLVDDVITTGATIEACALELLKSPGCRISVTTLCYAVAR